MSINRVYVPYMSRICPVDTSNIYYQIRKGHIEDILSLICPPGCILRIYTGHFVLNGALFIMSCPPDGHIEDMLPAIVGHYVLFH